MVSRGDPGLLSVLGQRSYAEGAAQQLAQVATGHDLVENPADLNMLLPEVRVLLESAQNLVGDVGDRHSDLWEGNREEVPKRERGTPTSQDSPPAAPSPKRPFDGRGSMDLDLGISRANPLGPAQLASLGCGRSP